MKNKFLILLMSSILGLSSILPVYANELYSNQIYSTNSSLPSEAQKVVNEPTTSLAEFGVFFNPNHGLVIDIRHSIYENTGEMYYILDYSGTGEPTSGMPYSTIFDYQGPVDISGWVSVLDNGTGCMPYWFIDVNQLEPGIHKIVLQVWPENSVKPVLGFFEFEIPTKPSTTVGKITRFSPNVSNGNKYVDSSTNPLGFEYSVGEYHITINTPDFVFDESEEKLYIANDEKCSYISYLITKKPVNIASKTLAGHQAGDILSHIVWSGVLDFDLNEICFNGFNKETDTYAGFYKYTYGGNSMIVDGALDLSNIPEGDWNVTVLYCSSEALNTSNAALNYFEFVDTKMISTNGPEDKPTPTPGPEEEPTPTSGPSDDPTPTPPGEEPTPTPGPGEDPTPTPGPTDPPGDDPEDPPMKSVPPIIPIALITTAAIGAFWFLLLPHKKKKYVFNGVWLDRNLKAKYETIEGDVITIALNEETNEFQIYDKDGNKIDCFTNNYYLDKLNEGIMTYEEFAETLSNSPFRTIIEEPYKMNISTFDLSVENEDDSLSVISSYENLEPEQEVITKLLSSMHDNEESKTDILIIVTLFDEQNSSNFKFYI